eukprot:1140310-Pelagomonas_calceolata.AAC.1
MPRKSSWYPLKSRGVRRETLSTQPALYLLPRSVALASSFQDRGTSILRRQNTVRNIWPAAASG